MALIYSIVDSGVTTTEGVGEAAGVGAAAGVGLAIAAAVATATGSGASSVVGDFETVSVASARKVIMFDRRRRVSQWP